ncbi:unnamed protein product [Arabidopsis halleri]
MNDVYNFESTNFSSLIRGCTLVICVKESLSYHQKTLVVCVYWDT